MANRTFNNVQALDREVKFIIGQVLLSAAAAVSSIVGKGFSAAKTGTGLYTITLQDKYPSLLSAQFAVAEAGNSAVIAKLVSETVVTDGKVNIKTCPANTGTPADVAAAVSVHFILALKNLSSTN